MTIHEAEVEKLVSGGQGLIRLDGLVVFVREVLAGERVRLTLGPVHKGFAQGTVVERLTDSASRRVPPCRWYGVCGGCDFMHLTEDAQRQTKIQWAVEAFMRIGKVPIDPPTLTSGSPWRYRARLQVHKTPQGNWGFKKQQSDEIVTVDDCAVAVSGFHSLWQSKSDSAPGRYTMISIDNQYYQKGNNSPIEIPVKGRSILSTLDGFFQSNLELLPALIDEVTDSFPDAEGRVLDLYGGVGLFGAFLADRFEIIVVEQNPESIALARRNIPGPGHEFHAMRLEAWARQSINKQKPLIGIVVDPPRSGLSAEVREFLTQTTSHRLTYVSCNPDTLARDARMLIDQGWKLVQLRLFDFYPQTTHLEAVARFVRA